MGNGYAFGWTCLCGTTGFSRFGDLKKDVAQGHNRACKKCATKQTMTAATTTDKWRSHHKRMVSSAAKAVAVDKEYKNIRRNMQCAKDRCINKNNRAYSNYGGRGVQFMFESAAVAARWILDNLGSAPSVAHSIDRINNNGHYEAGNLRWATRHEQNSNKRTYKVGADGERIRALRLDRPDLCYESIRTYVKQGLSDDDIKTKRKWGNSSNLRHSKLRSTAQVLR